MTELRSIPVPMPSDLFVSYLHADPAGSGRAEDALTAQRAAIARHLGRRGRLAAEIVETRSERRGLDRPGLREALALCRRRDATLLMAELGAFGADPAGLRALGGALRRHDLRLSVADSPEASARTLGIMAAVAEARWDIDRGPETMARRHAFYARVTAEWRPAAGTVRPPPPGESRGRDARARSRERAEAVAPILSEIRAAGAQTLEQVANALNALGVPAARGSRWYPMQVTRIEKRLAARTHAADPEAVRRQDPSFERPLHA